MDDQDQYPPRSWPLARASILRRDPIYRQPTPVAALDRARYAIENYDGAPDIKQALEISRDAYLHMGMKDQADRTSAVLALNFPAVK